MRQKRTTTTRIPLRSGITVMDISRAVNRKRRFHGLPSLSSSCCSTKKRSSCCWCSWAFTAPAVATSVALTWTMLLSSSSGTTAWMTTSISDRTIINRIGIRRSPIPYYSSSSSSTTTSSTIIVTSATAVGAVGAGATVQEDDRDEPYEHHDDPRTPWLLWMIGGKPRGTSKVVLREAEELGGVARSDRYSSRDWLHIFITMPNSEILRSIRGPVLAVTLWGFLWSLLHKWLLQYSTAHAASHMYIPVTPHSLMMNALGLLLVFRTNSAYQRFAEGRKIWEHIINISRDLYRIIMLYENEIGIEKRRRLQRLLAAFPYFLRHRIRPNLVMRRLDDDTYQRDPENSILLYQDNSPTDNDPIAGVLAQAEEETGKSRRKTRPLYWVDKRTLPWRLLPTDLLEPCARVQNRPLWVCDRMAQEISVVPEGPNFTGRERLTFLSLINKLSGCIGGAERIHQTVVPLNYARHTLRALTMFLFSLPFALIKDLGLWTAPVLFLVSWLLFGVYEIGYSIEDPFQGTLRLSILCDAIRRDVLGDELLRGSAFQMESPLDKTDKEIISGKIMLDEGDMEDSTSILVDSMTRSMNKEPIINEIKIGSSAVGSTTTVGTINEVKAEAYQ